jgi:hypothetical protein
MDRPTLEELTDDITPDFDGTVRNPDVDQALFEFNAAKYGPAAKIAIRKRPESRSYNDLLIITEAKRMYDEEKNSEDPEVQRQFDLMKRTFLQYGYPELKARSSQLENQRIQLEKQENHNKWVKQMGIAGIAFLGGALCSGLSQYVDTPILHGLMDVGGKLVIAGSCIDASIQTYRFKLR